MKINWSKFIGPIGKSKKYKFTKLPAQKVKRHSDFGRSSKIADQNIRDTLGPDPLEFGTVKHESARILRQESIGRRWAERKFARDLPQEIKKGRIVIWPAAFPYVHRGNSPLSGKKYILTSWMNLR